MEYIGRKELAQFIANGLKVKFMAITVSKKEPFGILLKEYIMQLPAFAYAFKRQLSNKLKGKTKEQLYSIEIDISKYLNLINDYINWYGKNEVLTNEFFVVNPYEIVFNELKFIKQDILLYFPNLKGEVNQPGFEPQHKKEFNPNYLNKVGYNLFNYLNDNYEKKGKIKFINLFYFMSGLHKENEYGVSFNFTQKKYNEFIVEEFNIEIKKFQQAGSYIKKELPILQNLTSNFFESLK